MGSRVKDPRAFPSSGEALLVSSISRKGREHGETYLNIQPPNHGYTKRLRASWMILVDILEAKQTFEGRYNAGTEQNVHRFLIERAEEQAVFPIQSSVLMKMSEPHETPCLKRLGNILASSAFMS